MAEKKPVIFIVEDNKELLDKEAGSLEQQGYQVYSAPKLVEAITDMFIGFKMSQVDLLLLDIKLVGKEETELELARFMRKKFLNDLPNFQGKILVTTSIPPINLAEEFEDLNIIGCLLKPFSVDELIVAVEASLRLDVEDLVMETGDRVLYEWSSGEKVKMRRQMIVDANGNVYKTGFWKRGGILSVCVPVVAGYCAKRCYFCAHGHAPIGSTRKLSGTEIVSSVRAALQGSLFQPPLEKGEKFDIAFAGEGDPSFNADTVIAAIRQLNGEFKEQIRRVIISTVSVKMIERLLQEEFTVPVQLQISTVFAEEERQQYMPGASPLDELLEAGVRYFLKTRQKLPVILNYILIKDLTDTKGNVLKLRRAILNASRGLKGCFKVKISNFNPIKQIDWQPAEGKSRLVKELLAEKGIPSFFWRVPPKREVD